MCKEISTFGDMWTFEKSRFYLHKAPILLKDVDIKKVLVSKKISFGKKTISTLLVTCVMIIRLSHYIYCFPKQALM